MDEYAKEIADLQREIDRLVEAEGDPREISDLQVQLDVLTALYRQAVALFELGAGDPPMRQRLAIRGYGPWTLDNVYAFVYEQAVELPDEAPRRFAEEIGRTDFEELLKAG